MQLLTHQLQKTISKTGRGCWAALPGSRRTTRRVFSQSLAPACAKPLRRRQGGTFGSWLHAFLGKTGNSLKVKSYVTLPFLKIRNCKGLEAPLSGFRYCNIWVKSGRVTIAGHPNDDLAPGTLNSILKQAKLKEVK